MSLTSEDRGRFDAQRPQRGGATRQDHNGRKKHTSRGERRRLGGGDVTQQPGEKSGQCQCRSEACNQPNQRKSRPVADHEPQNVPALSTERNPDTDLVSPLRHPTAHEAVGPNRGEHQSNPGKRAEGVRREASDSDRFRDDLFSGSDIEGDRESAAKRADDAPRGTKARGGLGYGTQHKDHLPAGQLQVRHVGVRRDRLGKPGVLNAADDTHDLR